MNNYVLRIGESAKEDALYTLRYKKNLPGDLDGGKLKAIKSKDELRAHIISIMVRWRITKAKDVLLRSIFPEFNEKYLAGIVKEIKEASKEKKD